MNRRLLAVICLGLLGLGILALAMMDSDSEPMPPAAPDCPDCPVTPDEPCPNCPTPKPNPPAPRPPRKPWGCEAQAPVGAQIGGCVSPSGTQMQCKLPLELQAKNIASKGLGCCVFRSIDHAARLQNVPALTKFPEWLVQRGIEGGGYPGKVSQLIPQICKDRGYPTPDYVQVELTGKEAIDFLTLGCMTGRMASVTYMRSPSGRYGGQPIAHMVNAAHSDGKWIGLLDNNYIGEDKYEWVTPEEFLKVCNKGGQVWIIFLLNPPPSPDPWN